MDAQLHVLLLETPHQSCAWASCPWEAKVAGADGKSVVRFSNDADDNLNSSTAMQL